MTPMPICPTCGEAMTEIADVTWRCRYCGCVKIVTEEPDDA